MLDVSITKRTNTYLLHVGDFIKQCRKEQGLSAYALANLAGITDNGLRFCEQGKTLPSLELIIKISLGLGIKPSEFLKKMEEYVEQVSD